ncbi:exosome complex exonuclease RRP46 homolog isoform X1 [Bidens hawaiensis]|uniref:exosome complex exonuclease RRP46 homolog isoform X1 n=2 Tax=Bidens hawaiensis TaxID=980011 RepID=UPI00404A7903
MFILFKLVIYENAILLLKSMEVDRLDGRTANQRRPVVCTRGVLHRAYGSASWAQGETKVIAAVYGPKAGTKKNENPEKACIEVIWKPKTGQSGKQEREFEMVLKKTLQSICLLNVHPNTTTSIIVQVVNDDGALLPCAINAACSALVDAGIPLKHLAVAICCCMAESGHVFLDPSKLEEQTTKAFVYLVFPNSTMSVLPQGSEVKEHGIITSVTHGVMAVDDYFSCVKMGRAAAAELSDYVRNSLKLKAGNDLSKAG